MKTFRPFVASAVLVALALIAPGTASAEPAVVRSFEAPVYSKPDAASPVLHVFHENATVSVSETKTGSFRKIRTPDGRVGYVEERVLSFAGASTTQEAPPVQAAPPPVYTAPAAPPPPPPSYYGRQPPPPPLRPPVRYVQDHGVGGLFLHLDIGAGFLNTGTTSSDRLANGAISLSAALGGVVAPNLMLAGSVWGIATPDASGDPYYDGYYYYEDGGSLWGIGPSLTYYLMPANVYLTATPSLTFFRIRQDGFDSSTTPGFGMLFAVGKEWWVLPGMGMGVAAQFMSSWNKDSNIANAPTWRSHGLAIAFSMSWD